MSRATAVSAAILVVVLTALTANSALARSSAAPTVGLRDAEGGVALARITSGQATAHATLEDAEGDRVGTARFAEVQDGVEINVEIERGGLEPGEHGIHLHEVGDVTPDFEAAGVHFDPTGAEHGFDNPQGPHAGDLENMIVSGDGNASYTTTTDRITLAEGERSSILDSDGSALVVHADPDDYETDPAGSSGDPVAAGVIEAGVAAQTQALLVGLGALVLLVLLGGLVIRHVRRTSGPARSSPLRRCERASEGTTGGCASGAISSPR